MTYPVTITRSTIFPGRYNNTNFRYRLKFTSSFLAEMGEKSNNFHVDHRIGIGSINR